MSDSTSVNPSKLLQQMAYSRAIDNVCTYLIDRMSDYRYERDIQDAIGVMVEHINETMRNANPYKQ